MLKSRPDDNKDLTDWSIGEALWLLRQRLGLAQEDAARRIAGVCVDLYIHMEHDRREPSPKARVALGRPSGSAPMTHLLRLARRRAGYGLRGTARRVKASHRTVLKWEEAADQRLVLFWVGRGYRFG